MADGTITFSTELDNSQLEADLKKAEKDVDSLKRKVEKSESERNAIADKMSEAREELSKTEEEIVRLAKRLKELDELAETDPAGAEARAEVVTEEFMKQAQLYDQQQTKVVELEGKWEALDAQARKYTADLDAARQRQAALGAEYARTMRGNELTNGIRAVEGRMDAFASRITRTMKKVFVFGVITKGLRTLKSYLTEALAENERFQASWSNLRATIQGVAGYVAQGLAPILTGFVNMVSAMITALASMVDSIFKTRITEAIAHARQAAQATGKQEKATRKLGKAASEASKQLMSFDEINAMNADTSNDAADALDDEAETPALDWNAFDVGKIDAKLAEIMLIIGAALVAVGAILCFSGINIPLGITLMAIGALMVYTAYQEQWDELPQEVRDAINAVLVITGIVLLVLGAVLAFSGINIPLGIGMMAAGALILWTEVAMNWDSMPDEIRGVVSVLMGILGVALLVIGAILTFSAANPMLGIGLMIVGAATLAGVAALNWEEMPDEVRQTVSTIMGILGGTLLVLGAILALSGAAAPLGVGLMIAGAALLATTAALNWDSMPQQVRDTVTELMAIIGSALIVIGVILIFTGAGIPLGIACILAGVASLVAAAAINWDFLKDKVREIWQGIVDFWNQHIAKVFTWEFWEGLFKSMVNGLIWAINSGLNAFGGFINDIADGISDVLNWLGVTGWSFSISMPQIPYLAQGAVIPPNRKFLAVLGDQTSGRNLEAPESLIRQIVREEAGSMDAAAMQQAFAAAFMQVLPMLQQQGGSDGDAIMVLRVGNEELARAVNEGNASLMRRGLINPELGFA